MANAFDQALQQALSKTLSRRGLIKGSIVAGASALIVSAFSGTIFPTNEASAAGPLDSDVEILNYALTLELLEADAYMVALSLNVLTGRALAYFKDFAAHEQAHVDAVTATIRQLGGTPVVKPAAGYNYSTVPRTEADLIKFFQVIEAVGASAYLGAAPSVKSLDVLAAALSIHASEAEHTAALADIVAPGTDLFAPESFATPRTPDQVLVAVAPFFAAPAASPSPSPRPSPSPTPRPSAPPPSPTPAPSMPGLPSTGGGWGAGQVSSGGRLEP